MFSCLCPPVCPPVSVLLSVILLLSSCLPASVFLSVLLSVLSVFLPLSPCLRPPVSVLCFCHPVCRPASILISVLLSVLLPPSSCPSPCLSCLSSSLRPPVCPLSPSSRWWPTCGWSRRGWTRVCLCSTKSRMWLKRSRMKSVSRVESRTPQAALRTPLPVTTSDQSVQNVSFSAAARF